MVFMVLMYRWLILDTHGEGDLIAARKKAREEKTGKSYGLLTVIKAFLTIQHVLDQRSK